ncbi:MAG: DinB family protein [Bacillota bacterium]
MAHKARAALRVRDLAASLRFYRDLLGWSVVEEDPAREVALIQLPSGTILLLTSSSSLDTSPWQGERFQEYQPGRRFYAFGTDLHLLEERLTAAGVTGMEMKGNETGRTLIIPDPDGYFVGYYEELPMTDEAILDLFARGPALLKEAVADLSESQLDLARAPGKWTIRQIVHHVVDSDLGTCFRLKFALAEPGRAYNGNAYSPDTWADSLDYAHRPVVVELQLLEALRQHLVALCRHLPGAMSRHVVMNGQPLPVGSSLKMNAGHLLDHLEQIMETRQVHGL